jgi:hypothetical protein
MRRRALLHRFAYVQLEALRRAFAVLPVVPVPVPSGNVLARGHVAPFLALQTQEYIFLARGVLAG